MFKIGKMDKSHPTFTRLMQAAAAIRDINSQAELARELNVPDQHLTNWKARGVPAKLILDLADEWGFRTKWLRDNDGEMTANYLPKKNSLEAQVLLAMHQMDETTKYQVVKICNSLIEPKPDISISESPKKGPRF
jgi:hypothetical protein